MPRLMPRLTAPAKRIVNAFKNAGIRQKMLVMVIGLMSASLGLNLLAQRVAFGVYDNQIYEQTSRTLNLSAGGIETQLREMQQLSFNVATDEQIQEALLEIKHESDPYRKWVLRSRLTNRLIALAGSEKYVYSMMLVTKGGGVPFTGNRGAVGDEFWERFVPDAEQAEGANRWVAHAFADSTVLSVREVRSYNGTTFTLESIGTLVIRVRLDRIAADASGGIAGVDGGSLIIADEAGAIYPVPPPLRDEDIRSALAQPEPYEIQDYGGTRYFTAGSRSAYVGWTYLSVIPFDGIFERISWIRRASTFSFLAILIVGIGLGARLSRSITDPVQRLISRMKRIEYGDLDRLEEEALGSVSPSDQSEVRLLQRTFRRMIRRIRELIDENYAKQLVIRETELKALQAQINPHFLYNTLESINWSAKLAGQTRISEMVEALGHLLRSSIGGAQPLIALREELDIVGSYITIQRMRFEERLDYRQDVPEQWLDTPIPKLTLQPLIENAIHYALEPKLEPCRISISASCSGGVLEISVEDDGPGMSPGFVDRLRRGEIATRGTGIGLGNIEERLRLTFGEAFGLEIGGPPGGGTRITLRIPPAQKIEAEPEVLQKEE
ncbi:sensor histidine kinase [Saccharibacillus sp. CPCC 101409]|uniref:cache domain-containing sensor histidine kinase n=1 Tax=Saccharibacillus sp. CPCC 101409 TaxID=3058041 RepID=UPI0026731A3B|nr:sensor histidine kinase [Saccharibacillus sp. CPCC 101409]MDO3412204.1 sensor histidine kinase [Saccharibacillus sp. CPCC 101409]